MDTQCDTTYVIRPKENHPLFMEDCVRLKVRKLNETMITLALDPAARSGQPYGQRNPIAIVRLEGL
jgi:hypothetical protein